MRAPRLAARLSLLVLAGTLAGCGSTVDGTDPVAGTTSSAGAPSEATSEPSPESPVIAPSESPTEGGSQSPTFSPTPTPTPSSTPEEEPMEDEGGPVARGLVGKLLTADEVPGFNDEFTWRTGATRKGEGRQPFGTCSKFPMTSIGAMKVATRTYVPSVKSPGSSASNLVARFADEMTAKRAFEVLKSWRGECEEELRRHDRTDVGELQTVTADESTAGWYLLTYGPVGGPDSAYFDAQGLVRSGSTISVLQMRLVGQDYNYPAGEEPMVGAVRSSAARIG